MRGESDKADVIPIDPLIAAASQALAAGDPLNALKRVALREDALALALRGIAMAQLGDLARARKLMQRAARAFGPTEVVARARCTLAEAEIALVSRDLGWPEKQLDLARAILEENGDTANAAHAGYLKARRFLLIGKLDDAERTLFGIDAGTLLSASRVGYELVAAGLAMRRIQTRPAFEALAVAKRTAHYSGISALMAEVDHVSRAFDAPAARLVVAGHEHLLQLDEVEALLASDALVVDACRHIVRTAHVRIPLASRPVLFTLVRVLAEGWPEEVSRETLLARAFQARHINETHRARLRVEIGRLRKSIKSLAALNATKRGFVLTPHDADRVVVLVPPVESEHGELLALLADGEAWTSSALALALGFSQRTVQRSLLALAETGAAESFGRGRSCRWTTRSVPGFPTTLLLPTDADDS